MKYVCSSTGIYKFAVNFGYNAIILEGLEYTLQPNYILL
jgi:hypothetical protein